MVVKATRLIGGQSPAPRHALRPMGEPRYDIMAIFREAAAADKVCLHAVQLRVYTTRPGGGSTADCPHNFRVARRFLIHGLNTKCGYFDLSLVNCYSSELSTVAGRKEVSPDSVQQSAHSKFGSFYARTERTFGQLINQEDKKGGLRCFVEDFIEHCFRFLFYVYQDGNYFL